MSHTWRKSAGSPINFPDDLFLRWVLCPVLLCPVAHEDLIRRTCHLHRKAGSGQGVWQIGVLIWRARQITGGDILGFTTGLSGVRPLGPAPSGEGGQPEALLEEDLAL